MLAKIASGATIGLDGTEIEVEVDVASRGLPTLTIVGLPDKAIDEAKERVKAAIVNSSFEMPESRITVNLAPADIPKEGSAYDLPIALGILTASGMIEANSLSKKLFIGELSLEGIVRRVPGVISIVLMAKERGFKEVYVPYENKDEAALIQGIIIYPVKDLGELVLHLNKEKPLLPYILKPLKEDKREQIFEFDFADVRGQEQAKRALEIAAAGNHNIHLKGVPGAGKTMLSRAFASILPPMTNNEVLEVTKIYSIVGLTGKTPRIIDRPFRTPHHTTSRMGLVGGGTHPSPGEISLAHRGVLFLDEFAEFPRSTLEALRQPLEDGIVTISRVSGSLTFPARFLLVAASNPCPCGYLGHPKKQCHCLPGNIVKYKKRLSGPILDRIDLHVDVPPVEEEKLLANQSSEKSKNILSRVIAVRAIQKKRFGKSEIQTNAEMRTVHVREFCTLSAEAVSLLKQAISRFSLSARSYFKVIKISQTIADLEGEAQIDERHVAEALQYRAKDG